MAPDSLPILVFLHPKIQMLLLWLVLMVLSTRPPREGSNKTHKSSLSQCQLSKKMMMNYASKLRELVFPSVIFIALDQ
jgi:hypothetical protein